MSRATGDDRGGEGTGAKEPRGHGPQNTGSDGGSEGKGPGTGGGDDRQKGSGRDKGGGKGRSRGRRGRRRGGRRRGGQGRQDRGAQQTEKQAPPPGTLVTYLARAGLGSRRRCDEMVKAGRVAVNGEVVEFPRHKISPDDVITLDGEAVEPKPLRYILLDKPRGVASTRSDPHADRPIVDLVPDGRTLFPVGRLDVETTGLIVLTNDGGLAHRLMHPRYGVPKCYLVRVRGRVGRRALATLRKGVLLEDGMTAPAQARLVKQGAKTALVELTIHQGRKRQVRRMFAALGLKVEELHRTRYGPLSDDKLKIGKWRELTVDEVDALRRAAEHVEERVSEEPEEEAVLLAEPAADGSSESETAADDDGPATGLRADDREESGGDG